MSELLITCVLLIIVLPPKQWPMLLFYLAKFIQWVNRAREAFLELCKTAIQQYELTLREKEAKQADKNYHSDSLSPKNHPET
jgi:Sec-independent protein translocase protein TatA